jgi:hypothetical protein
MARRWSATTRTELSKLTSKERDWSFSALQGPTITTRTHHGGQGRPNLAIREIVLSSSSDESSNGGMDIDEAPSTSTNTDPVTLVTEDTDEIELRKPPASRVIIEVAGLTETLNDNCHCWECKGPVEVSLRTTCLATSIMLTCKTSHCGYIYYGSPPAQVAVDNEDSRERSTDYAINILYVIGFLASGDGCKEAARILGLCLPNDTTMERRSFSIIEERISHKIQELNSALMLENLIEEARMTMEASEAHDENDYQLWLEAVNNPGAFVLSQNKYPPLVCSFDMGWQQRSSGNRYNSLSGHALLVGAFTRKPISFLIKSKRCNTCVTWKKANKDLVAAALADGEELLMPYHECTKNHDGTSGSMEAQACLEMVVQLHEKFYCHVSKICADDDASTRSMLKWSNEDYMRNNNTTVEPTSIITKGINKGKSQKRANNGRLPAHVREPYFVADPNHRKKVLTGDLYNFATAKVSVKGTMTKMDATRIGKNFAYMIRQLPSMPEEQYLTAGKAVFDKCVIS